jgi:dihydrofolate synthase/folylpolyglutamate synthase
VSAKPHRGWSAEEAEQYVLSLELFGMNFGLERMRRLMTALDHPQRRFGSIHVVGSNGKSSTTRMTAAILDRHGVRTGAYLSPHLGHFWERIRVGDADISPRAFAAAVERAAHAAELVDKCSPDRVTQFEVLTAAAYSELARRGVEVAVVEAGLGGRYDATNVIPSKVQVLTGVSLEHTRWLGPRIADIAREKLAVVQPGGVLVLGPFLHPDAAAEAREAAVRTGARIIVAADDPGIPIAPLGAFQRRNFAVAQAAAEAYLGSLEPDKVLAAAAEVQIPGRLQVAARDPLTLLDGAHNVEGMAALVESLPAIADGRRAVALVSILDDKDAARMLATLLPVTDAVILTSSQNPRALPPPTLKSLARQLGGPPAEVLSDPRAGLERARALAGPDGVVIATGSIYLVADLLRTAPARVRASML